MGNELTENDCTMKLTSKRGLGVEWKKKKNKG